MTDLRDVLRLITYVAQRYHGHISMAERTNAAMNECVLCVDVRDSMIVAGPERLSGMNAAIREAVTGHFPGVELTPLNCDDKRETAQMFKQYFQIKETSTHRPNRWGDIA
jgi:hypothetical protein